MAAQKRKLFDHRWMLGLGIVLLLLGSGPLLSLIILAKLGVTADPNPNPIGLGMLAMFTFWPSIALIVAGLILRRRSHSRSNV